MLSFMWSSLQREERPVQLTVFDYEVRDFMKVDNSLQVDGVCARLHLSSLNFKFSVCPQVC